MTSSAFLYVGLGNPGDQYVRTRHNIGFMVIDALAQALKATPPRLRFEGLFAQANDVGHTVFLLKPQTFMNESGRSVQALLHFYKIPLENIMVFHDELDLPLGAVRVKVGGGDAGHNGLRSITTHCSANYRRVRCGIGHPGDKSRVTGHVLGGFHAEEQEHVTKVLEGCVTQRAAFWAKATGSWLF
jgi:peptidyl-tRNA hydrolase, PTH1 family